MKNVVISGYYGGDNFGDEAILKVLINKLKELDFNITVFSKNPEKTASIHNVNAFKTFNLWHIIKEIFKSDTLISGGGSLLQDSTSLASLIYYLFVIFTALFFGKKVIIFAQGIGPIKNVFARIFTQILLKNCSLVTVRDEKSLNLLNNWGIKATLVNDPIYSLDFIKPNPQSIVGVQLRDFKTLSDELLNKLAQSVNTHFKNKKIKIFSFQDSVDLDVCKKFEQILKSINPEINTELIFNKTPKEIIEEISTLEYMIAMRFHACLVAMKFEIKTLAICYDLKLETLAQEAHIPAISMNASENYDEIFTILKNLNIDYIREFIKPKTFDWKVFTFD